MQKLSASIVIVTVNRADSLERTLSSLDQLRYDNFEVIVVNGPSTDNTAAVIDKYGARLRSFATDRSNISVSRNIGLAHARGEIVAFIDDDAIPEPDWLDALLQPYADPQIATVGGFIRDADGFNFQARYTVCDRFGDTRPFADSSDFSLDENTFLSLTGTNFSARRTALLAVGGFDEEYIWFLDETDLNLRMHNAGLGFAVAPLAEIHHKYEAGLTRTRSSVPRTMYPQLRSKAYFCVRHNLGRRPLGSIFSYLADYVRKEREWKRNLLTSGAADSATVDRLISEVERGVEDGVTDAFRFKSPIKLSDGFDLESTSGDFKRFPPRRAADERLRVCLLSREYPPMGNGGIGQWTREVAVGLASRGHEVTVIARALEGKPRIDFVEGVWVHRVDPAAITEAEAAEFAPAPASLTAYAYALFREAARIDIHRRFDLISGPIADLEPMVCLKLSSVPVIVSLHTTFKLSLPHKPDWLGRPDYLAGHVEPAVLSENAMLVSSPHLLANSQAVVRDIVAAHGVVLDPARIAIIPHGIRDLALDVPTPANAENQTDILFVGRLEERKGADVFLSIVPDLLAAHPQAVVHIVGESDIDVGGKTLKRRFEDDNANRPDVVSRTRFHGALPRNEVLAHYAACDVFVAPSKYESFGLIFIEAMSFGKPVVAYDVGGASELIHNGEDGLLAPVNDPAALSKAVLRLMEDKPLRLEIGRNARKTYERCYTAERMVDSLETYYRSVLAKSAV